MCFAMPSGLRLLLVRGIAWMVFLLGGWMFLNDGECKAYLLRGEDNSMQTNVGAGVDLTIGGDETATKADDSAHDTLRRAAQAGCLLLLCLSVAGYFGRGHHLCELTSHFKVQYFFAALILMACLFLLRSHKAWVVCAFATLCLNFSMLAPWYLATVMTSAAANSNAEQSEKIAAVTTARTHLKILFSNLLYGNRDHDSLIELVRIEQPDVFICQEFTAEWAQALSVLRGEYPTLISIPRPDGSGIALFSRIPLAYEKVLTLGPAYRPGIYAQLRLEGATVSLLTIHPPTPIAAADFRDRNWQLAEAADFAREMPGPKIVIGDLNTSIWSPYLADFKAEAKLVDARAAGGAGILPTWPTFLPRLLRLPIDQCFVSRELNISSIKTGAQIGSDHLPLIVELDVAPQRQ